MTTRAILLAAARHLERHGWTQGARGSRGTPCCAVGAIGVAAGSAHAAYEAVAVVRQHLGVHGLSSWNDQRGRRAAEVTAALRGAARTRS